MNQTENVGLHKWFHGITSGRLWHFPSPLPSSDVVSPNASFDVVILADGYTIRLPRHYQGELKKPSASDATSYETIITEISREDFIRLANSTVVTIQLASLASFDLDSETMAALKDFATRVTVAKQSRVEGEMRLSRVDHLNTNSELRAIRSEWHSGPAQRIEF